MENKKTDNIDLIISEAISDVLQWENCAKTSFSEFLEYVTLHDSRLENLSVLEGNEVVMVFHLDAFWNKDYCEAIHTTDWPVLIFRFSGVISIWTATEDYEKTIGSSSSRSINVQEIASLTQIMSDHKLATKTINQFNSRICRTDIENVHGGTITLFHSESVEVLLISPNGNYLNADHRKVKPLNKRE